MCVLVNIYLINIIIVANNYKKEKENPMIFYFSGTGNSLWVAKTLSKYQNEQILSIADLMQKKNTPFSFSIKPDEMIGFVFPIYAWAPPKIVMDFIRNLKITNYNNQYTFAVCTCGDTSGRAINALRTNLKHQNIILNSGFSIFMPNNYIILYDVDSKELTSKKLVQAEQRIEYINDMLSQKKYDIFDCYEGNMPSLRTKLINPLFNTFAMGTKAFYAKSSCISCGLCSNVCPTKNIQLVDGTPKWDKECTKCLACIHRCPVRAIQYRKSTESKGRYYNPNC
jgi:ferredoxin/flavodoxin